MKFQESIDRSELRKMQREQERERRRIRDRQRRQSMTVEQRERHLARRRRNYQLRRLRAENAKVDNNNNNNQISNELPHEDEEEEAAAVSDAQPETLECLDDKESSNLSNKRLRLSHVRRLARSGSKMVGEEMTQCGDASSTPCIRIGEFESGRLPNGLRLNRVKRLARAINTSSSEQASVNGYQVTDNNKAPESDSVEQNRSLKNCQVISNENSDSDKLSLSEVKLKDLTWTDNHQSWANVESSELTRL